MYIPIKDVLEHMLLNPTILEEVRGTNCCNRSYYASLFRLYADINVMMALLKITGTVSIFLSHALWGSDPLALQILL